MLVGSLCGCVAVVLMVPGQEPSPGARPTTTLAGTIHDEAGQPIEGITPMLVRPGDPTDVEIEGAASDSDGRFSFAAPVPAGLWALELRAARDDFAAARLLSPDRIVVPADPAERRPLSIIGRLLRPIEGTVTDLDGHPVADASVFVDGDSTAALLDDDGTFTVAPELQSKALLEHDRVRLTIPATSTHRGATTDPVAWGTTGVVIGLVPATTATVTIAVLDEETHQPVTDYSVDTIPLDEDAFSPFRTVSDDHGEATLTGLRRSEVAVAIEPEDPRLERTVARIEVPTRSAQPVRIEVAHRLAIEVVVTDDAKRPLSGAEVTVHPLGIDEAADSSLEKRPATKTDERGHARVFVPHLATGAQVRVRYDGIVVVGSVSTSTATPSSIVVPAGRVRVRGHASGKPPGDDWAIALVPDGIDAATDAATWLATSRRTALRPDGSFALAEVPAGRWRLWWIGPRWLIFDTHETVAVSDGDEADVTLAPPYAGVGGLDGRLEDTAGQLPVRVTLVGDVGAVSALQRDVLVDADGRFHADALPEGHYRVALADGVARGLPVAMSREAVEVVAGETVQGTFLPRTERLRLRFVDPDGAPLERAGLVLMVDDVLCGVAAVDANGEAEVEVPDRPLDVVLTQRVSRLRWRGVVPAGKPGETAMRIVLQRDARIGW